MINWLKEVIRRRIGFIPILEWRNRVFKAPAVPRILQSESREVGRLLEQIGGKRARAKVACIVPTYRRPDRVIEAVQSILDQSFQDFVVIVVDDGGGLPRLPDDHRVVGVSLSENVGIAGVVRNVGIRLSQSDFIAFLDDDNTWRPQHLSMCVEALDSQHDLVYTAIARRTPSGRDVDVISKPFDRRTFINDAYVDTSAIVVRRSSDVLFSRLPRGRGGQTLPGEDWEFVYRLSRRARVKHIPTVTVDYLVNPESFYTPWSADATR